MALTEEEKDLLRKAADEVDRRGLTYRNGRSYDEDLSECKVCTLGAVALVTYGHPDNWAVHPGIDGVNEDVDDFDFRYVNIVNTIAEVLGTTATGVYDWNDAVDTDGRHRRTKDEVVALMRRVADAA
jgi:hypothetical protein